MASLAQAFTVLILSLALLAASPAIASQCYGSVSNGRIVDAVRLPAGGENFAAYSALGVLAGRTYVHSKVAAAVTGSYASIAQRQPELHFVYAETGWAKGGRIRPHRTHQNGLSVDFMVPVRDGQGQSAALPSNLANRYGYDIEFDRRGRFEDYTIDYAAMAEHLYQLRKAAMSVGIDISLVIFDPPLLPQLFATSRGEYLRTHLKFLARSAWVRHDEHYHVDFAVPCKSMSQ